MWTLGITLWLVAIATVVYQGLVLLESAQRQGWRAGLQVYRRGGRWHWPAVWFWLALAVVLGGVLGRLLF